MKKIIYTLVLSLLGLSAYAQTWSVGSGSLFTNPNTTKIGIGITPSSTTEFVHINGGALKIGNTSNINDRAINMIKIGDGDYIKIGEWEQDDQLSLYASKGFSFNSGYAMTVTHTATADWGCASLIRVNRNLTNAFLIRSSASGQEKAIFNIYGNGIVNAKKIYAEEFEITPNAMGIYWYDHVFAQDYKLRPLSEVEQFIQENKHLPEIPSEKEVKENGFNLGDMQGKLLMKIEELTLYLIEQQKLIEELQKRLSELETRKGGE